ncbi:sulfite oxidase [Modestobacter sp. DSM 44400]|uniref:sulfite oxidase n=1 Tax=Modestobacter sp. DSM 44400 TaxID=1550230 RepID=UPI000897B13E|nr:sulfite oxidase [Modestobacter sp. DSM 44400]SDX91918.1 sulfite oxidase [Modestobacter sp. DSM 44400]
MSSWDKREDMLVHEQDPYNAEPPVSALAGHPVTAVDTFYSRNHGPVPDLDPTSWRLRVDGLVEHPVELSLADLQARFVERTLPVTLQCAGNRRAGLIAVRDIPGEDPWQGGATSTATWTGVALGDVLDAAGLLEEAQHVCFQAPDVSHIPDPPEAYGASVPVGKATSPEVLLAWAMNGRALTPVHGAPVRLVVPGWIGARSVKWLQHVTASAESFPGHFQATAYRLLPPAADPGTADAAAGPSLGPVALNCEILAPGDGQTRPAGPVTVTGYAYAGEDRTVERVDVSADRGVTWVQARVDAPDGPWTWQHWRIDVDLPPGTTELTARAWDPTGALQPQQPEDLWNPKGYVNNSWARVRVTAT